jgi:hypothetical protein
VPPRHKRPVEEHSSEVSKKVLKKVRVLSNGIVKVRELKLVRVKSGN